METEEAQLQGIPFANTISVRCLALIRKGTFPALEVLHRREIIQQLESVERITSISMWRGLSPTHYTQLKTRQQESMPIQLFKVEVNRDPLALITNLDGLRLNEIDFSFCSSVIKKRKSSRN